MVVAINRIGDRVFIYDFSNRKSAMIWEAGEDEMYIDGDSQLIKDYIGQRNGLNYFGDDWSRHHKKGYQPQGMGFQQGAGYQPQGMANQQSAA